MRKQLPPLQRTSSQGGSSPSLPPSGSSQDDNGSNSRDTRSGCRASRGRTWQACNEEGERLTADEIVERRSSEERRSGSRASVEDLEPRNRLTSKESLAVFNASCGHAEDDPDLQMSILSDTELSTSCRDNRRSGQERRSGSFRGRSSNRSFQKRFAKPHKSFKSLNGSNRTTPGTTASQDTRTTSARPSLLDDRSSSAQSREHSECMSDAGRDTGPRRPSSDVIIVAGAVNLLRNFQASSHSNDFSDDDMPEGHQPSKGKAKGRGELPSGKEHGNDELVLTELEPSLYEGGRPVQAPWNKREIRMLPKGKAHGKGMNPGPHQRKHGPPEVTESWGFVAGMPGSSQGPDLQPKVPSPEDSRLSDPISSDSTDNDNRRPSSKLPDATPSRASQSSDSSAAAAEEVDLTKFAHPVSPATPFSRQRFQRAPFRAPGSDQ